MADGKKTSLSQALGKLKNAKKTSPTVQDDANTKSSKRRTSDSNIADKIKNSVSKFDRD